ncbi:hypothetical protein [Colwellia psychrerythraea]|uniref:Uncharacterized protein n=1 Tax=Colwellia psychrerythraea (strain 34H / ATCC BAA-681) TaxID=167879 RepID=Q487W7_COLP3|nr:hypothetical protein [Colwellia psychrerythraea]AAZ25961.1 hypothetical protein CPS_0899 [Colwellia psychrerythraea 34H]
MNEKKFIPRQRAPFVSMGFRLASGDELCIVDFLDLPDDNVTKVETSIAITKNQAKKLIEGLQEFINED